MKSNNFDRLKKHMSQAFTVRHWNVLREEAKSHYTEELIRRLDSSGLISKILNAS